MQPQSKGKKRRRKGGPITKGLHGMSHDVNKEFHNVAGGEANRSKVFLQTINLKMEKDACEEDKF